MNFQPRDLNNNGHMTHVPGNLLLITLLSVGVFNVEGLCTKCNMILIYLCIYIIYVIYIYIILYTCNNRLIDHAPVFKPKPVTAIGMLWLGGLRKKRDGPQKTS